MALIEPIVYDTETWKYGGYEREISEDDLLTSFAELSVLLECLRRDEGKAGERDVRSRVLDRDLQVDEVHKQTNSSKNIRYLRYITCVIQNT
jgi:type VI protein secretion system component VasF